MVNISESDANTVRVAVSEISFWLGSGNMRRYQFALVPFVFGIVLSLSPSQLSGQTPTQREVASSSIDWSSLKGLKYRYAPVAIEEGGKRYLYYCANVDREDRPVITDHIMLRIGVKQGASWVYGPEKIVLRPSEKRTPSDDIWDLRHVCDPAVVAGEFRYRPPDFENEETFSYALFYLGLDKEIEDGGTNQIGVAVSQKLEGPWFKVGGNPLIRSREPGTWGVGQPSVCNRNQGGGRVTLFYTRGDRTRTATFFQEVDLSEAQQPKFGGEQQVTTNGLTQRNGEADLTNNGGDFLFDETRNRFWIIRPGHPHSSVCPSFISDFIQLAWIDAGALTEGRWKVQCDLSPPLPPASRYFDPGFVSDPFGAACDGQSLTVMPSISRAGENCPHNWLYSYRIKQLTIRDLD